VPKQPRKRKSLRNSKQSVSPVRTRRLRRILRPNWGIRSCLTTTLISSKTTWR
jgi:hypothetical protein